MKSVMVSQLFLLYVMCYSVLHFKVMIVAQQSNAQQQEPPKHHATQPKVYTNQFVLQIEGGPTEAREIASKHGFVYLDHIFGDYHHLQHRRIAKRSTSSDSITKMNISIEEEPQVISLQQQVLKRRVKRDLLDLGPTPQSALRPQAAASPLSNTSQFARVLHPMGISRRPLLEPMSSEIPSVKSGGGGDSHLMIGVGGGGGVDLDLSASGSTSNSVPAPLPPSPMYNHLDRGGNLTSVSSSSQDDSNNNGSSRPTTASFPSNGGHTTSMMPQFQFNDPNWSQMWYLDRGAKNGFDLNVMAAWSMGYTGKGIVITILDDGLEKDHPDLQANYDPKASFDINGDDSDPMPRYDMADSNRHGTRCAGEVAAVSENNICSVGIAFNSKVGGVRMLDGDVTDAVEARSLSLNQQHIDIYSASWGPDDNGKTVDGPGELATHAFIEGVTNGRQGLGSIFVFASGNGGREFDNCNCDGYTNSIWTLSISSATENGLVPWYSEACSSTLATTYSSGSYDERQIITTDLHHSCTSSHTGTSASAPLAAGICALVLEANPKLTWRDMQHIVVRTAKPANLIAKDWRTNSLGRNVSHSFGYGLMDAAAMIHMAKRWNTVPIQYTCEVRSPTMDKAIPSKGYIELKLQAACNNIHHLEHVQSKITLNSNRRGDLHIYLVSPHGTRSTLLAQRPHDTAKQGFRNWPFMTVHSWGEHPNGEWTLEVHNEGKAQNRAHLKEWTLILYGTDVDVNSSLQQQQHQHQQKQQQQQQEQHRQKQHHNNHQLASAPTRIPQPLAPAAPGGGVTTLQGFATSKPSPSQPTIVPAFSLPTDSNVPTTPTTTISTTTNPVTNFPTIEATLRPAIATQNSATPSSGQQATAVVTGGQQQLSPATTAGNNRQQSNSLHDQSRPATTSLSSAPNRTQPIVISPNTDRYMPKAHHNHNHNHDPNHAHHHHHHNNHNQQYTTFNPHVPPSSTPLPPISHPKLISSTTTNTKLDEFGNNTTTENNNNNNNLQSSNQPNEFIYNKEMEVPKSPVGPPMDDNKIDIIKPSIHQTTSTNINSEKSTTTPPIVIDEFGNNGMDNNQITGSATKDYRSSGNNQLLSPNSGSRLASHIPPAYMLLTLTLTHTVMAFVVARTIRINV